jgi:hypothetical protein
VAAPNSATWLTKTDCIDRPNDVAAACACCAKIGVALSSVEPRKATRCSPGIASRNNSRCLGTSVVRFNDTPVMLPPGRASVATRLLPTASATPASTIGACGLAACIATAAGVVEATIRSSFMPANSAAWRCASSARVAQRHSDWIGPALVVAEVRQCSSQPDLEIIARHAKAQDADSKEPGPETLERA